VCETYRGLENGDTAISGTRIPSWSKLAQLSGKALVGVKPGQNELSSPAFKMQFSPSPGSALAGGFEASAH